MQIANEMNEEGLVYIQSLDLFALYNQDVGCYNLLAPAVMEQRIHAHVRKNFYGIDPTKSTVRDVSYQLSLLATQVPKPDNDYLAFTDRLLNLNTFEYESHDRDIICIFSLPYSSKDLDQPTPHFDSYLESTFATQELRDFFLTAVASLLVPNTTLPVAFFFVGEGSNGKSVAADTITAMFGEKYVISMPLETLTTNKYATSALVGKRLNVCNEEESQHLKTDKFKAFVSGDQISAERKYGALFSFRPTAKFVFCSNNLPTFKDMDLGIKRRIQIIPFEQTFSPQDRDLYLTDKLKDEMPGILNQVIRAARALRENNYELTPPREVAEAILEFQMNSNSVVDFAENNLIFSPEAAKTGDSATNSKGWTPMAEVYSQYRSYCHDSGRQPFGKRKFANELKRHDPRIVSAVKGFTERINPTGKDGGWTDATVNKRAYPVTVCEKHSQQL